MAILLLYWLRHKSVFSLAFFLSIENALEGKILLDQIWFGYYFGYNDAKASSICIFCHSEGSAPFMHR
jgi:hypothetical protein